MSWSAVSEENSAKFLPLWEYGIGAGHVRYAQYPASNQYAELNLPFPTFQYRGDILRADDQEGASLYFVRGKYWSVELSGDGYLPLESNKNDARRGMENLPLMGFVGPQLVYKPNPYWEFSLNFFQAISADSFFIKKTGVASGGHAYYHWEKGNMYGQVGIGFNVASKEVLSTYFQVNPKDATADRPAFSSRAGFLNSELNYIHAISFNDLSLYFGGTISDYSWSINRRSPLHKEEYNVAYLVGVTYVLGQSSKPAPLPENKRGLIGPVKDAIKNFKEEKPNSP